MCAEIAHTNLLFFFLISVLTLLLQCWLKFYEFELILTHFIASMRGALEIKFKDTNIRFGFISTGNSKEVKIQNHPRHKIDFIASGLDKLLNLYINTTM